MDEEIKKILDNHEERIKKLEKVLVKPNVIKAKKDKKSLSEHIIGLREEGFFAQPQTAREVHKKLEGMYPCELNRVEVALTHFGGKELRISSKEVAGKKLKAYVW